jgi:hypothetical protein
MRRDGLDASSFVASYLVIKSVLPKWRDSRPDLPYESREPDLAFVFESAHRVSSLLPLALTAGYTDDSVHDQTVPSVWLVVIGLRLGAPA